MTVFSFKSILSVVAGLSLTPAVWAKAPANFELRPEQYPESLIVLTDGNVSWSPVAGFGPIIVDGGEALQPGEYEVALQSSEVAKDGQAKLVYAVVGVSPRAEFSISVQPDASGLTVEVEGMSGEYGGVATGHISAAETIIGFVIPERDREDYPQHSLFPNIFYNRDLGIWLQGRWDLDYGNASGAENLYVRNAKSVEGIDAVYFPGLTTNDGNTNVEALTEYYLDNNMIYVAFKQGGRLPLKERFRLTRGERLWDAVPEVPQAPSPYMEAMSELLYVDIWGGLYSDRSRFTEWLQGTVGKWVDGLTIVQNWQGGGFDSHLPLAVSDELPPNPRKAGTSEELKAWMAQMKSWGLVGLRTNYQLWKDTALQTVKQAKNLDGSPKWHTQPQDVMPIILQQETWIQEALETTATFSDQLTSGGAALPYVEYSEENPESGTIRGARNALRAQALLIKETVGGPLLSETLNGQFLIGEYVDSGDYGIFEGYKRMITPEFKLRRLHHLTTYFGMGLGYRYFYAPPYGGTNGQNLGNGMYAAPWGPGSDDYRAMTIAYGNGAYLDYLSADGMQPDKALTEAMTVGLLQRYYVNKPVKDIYYETPVGWWTLEELLLDGQDPTPFFVRMKIIYENGLTVVVNREADELPWTLPVFGDIILPARSYAAYLPDGSVEGFSGIPVGASDQPGRIDYTRDDRRGLLFINPRATGYDDLEAPTIFENETKVYELPIEMRYRPGASHVFKEQFSERVLWVMNRKDRVSHLVDGRDAFAHLAPKDDTQAVRIDRRLRVIPKGMLRLRYRSNNPEGVPSGSVSLMRFKRQDDVLHELEGRQSFVLKDTAGEWVEAEFAFEMPAEGADNMLLRIAMNDDEIPGVLASTGSLDVDAISINIKE
ncbi:hypothetical protein [Coraliomargarita parva]|uniref:hypothetical protein n=1 Tax=Coraliomargarita parva TaxID=3014050 RepID=UPI0022B2F7B4|nr:hypothetical protein [Coraliomargarita parva]